MALKSLSEQTFTDFEIIVLEHGSTDNSLYILNSWHDERLRLEVLPENIGRTSALNRCLKRSSGKYIAILDSDDVADPERFRLQCNFLDAHQNVGVVGTWSSFIDDLGHRFYEHRPATTHQGILRTLATKNPFTNSSILYRRELAMEIGGYDFNFLYAQDFDFIVKMAMRSEVSILPNSLCFWRESSTSLTNNALLPLNRLFEEAIILKKVRTQLDLDLTSQTCNRLKLFALRMLILLHLVKSRDFFGALLTSFSIPRGRTHYLCAVN